MRILFIHPNMPGQFKHLCRRFAQEKGNEVVFITKPKPGLEIPGVRKIEYKPTREPSASTHRYIIGLERGVLCGQEVWRAARELKKEGFVPDVIVAHPGWGDALYIHDIFHTTPLLSYFEFYYSAYEGDVNFDPADPVSIDDYGRIRTKNAINLFSLQDADWGISPTHWQFSRHPKEFRSKISVVHDGVDTEVAVPDASASFAIPQGPTFKAGDEVVTYFARNFEPYRGFPSAMRAFKILQKRRPNCHIIAVGADGVSYGKRPPAGKTYRQMMMEETQLDQERIHFVGFLPYGQLIKAMQVSAAHLYLTYPFVLSWSMLEAMSCECLIVGSATPPVQEVLTEGENGLLVDFFSPEQIADRLAEALERPAEMREIRKAARQFVVDRYSLSKLLPLHMSLVKDVAAKKFPPPTAERINALYSGSESKAFKVA